MDSPDKLFLDNLLFIKKAAACEARHYRFSREESEDFYASLLAKLCKNDYEVFRSFRGPGKLESYLGVVVTRHARDHANSIWGKWRVCAEAKRLGETAERIDRLVYRDGLSPDEAYEILKKDGVSREEFDEILLRLPPRVQKRFEGEEALAELPSNSRADRLILERERVKKKREIWKLLNEALAQLASEDWLILRMKSEGTPLQAIAQMLHLDPKQIYRRREALLKGLRKRLEEAGVHSKDVSSVLGDDEET